MFEGLPNFPDESRYWELVERFQLTQFYTAPTAIRTLMKAGDRPVKKHDRSTLRVLGTVGEPINPAGLLFDSLIVFFLMKFFYNYLILFLFPAWRWYFETVGEKRCPIVDTYWQTETGSVLSISIH